ncbi:Protein of unknown function DUF262 [Alicyclobacillus hesperidum]|uniref:GmrSD restriction endonucleases N-terminal domain-containing protein n=1 Tax=Alicyclobacillus hesperidum TaxID=89784 RepID=A0A1H2YE50_9BACL|nr:DUF262 domain-containing protein [Alicyclobacillus hesperidum]SDX02934.1 Protein of unknown function DUF262 [Alicyclobacillus hesperidum]
MDYEVSLQTIAWFNDLRRTGKLEISPKFQRRAVWLDKERSELIATICDKLPFPEVYIQVVTNQETGEQQYIVVDGQQRITSILRFIDGEVSLPTDSEWQGEDFKELSPDSKRNFWDYKVVVRMLRNTNDAEIRELFQRLNTNNIVLNDQELRNARYSGRFKQACEDLADDPFFQNIGLFTPKEVRRMEDIEFVSELLVLVMGGVQNKKDFLEDYYAANNEEFPDEARYLLEFRTSINLLQQITTEENQSLFKTKSNFYSLFGGCVRYYRTYKRTTFRNPSEIAAQLTDLLQKARNFRTQEISDGTISDYYEAVSRAASDKQRRARREDIIYNIIQEVEGSIG